MAFVCGRHRAYVYDLGGHTQLAELPLLNRVRWKRVRDDVSTAEVTVPTSECCDILAELRTIEHEIHVHRNDKVVWQGPLTRIEHEADFTDLFAEDVLWQAKRSVIQQSYDQSYPNIGNVIDRMEWLLHHCYDRYGDPWRMADHIHPIHGSDDPRTARIVFAWQMYVWDDLDKYAEDYGADYVVYNRDIYFFDTQLRWLILPDLDDTWLSQSPRIVEYGNQAGTRGIVTNGRGYAGVSAIAEGSQVRYSGAVVDWLTTNEPDGQPGLAEDEDGNPIVDPDADRVPTPEEIAGWTETATRSITERYPPPVGIVIPANTTLLPGAPWSIEQLVPGAWFQISTTRLCRTVTEWQRLQEITVEESAPNGETVQFSAVSAPAHAVDMEVRPPPPWEAA